MIQTFKFPNAILKSAIHNVLISLCTLLMSPVSTAAENIPRVHRSKILGYQRPGEAIV